MPFKSQLPSIEVPNITLYNFLFTNPVHSPLLTKPQSILGSFISSTTDTPLPFLSIRDHTIHLSTVLYNLYKFRPGDVLASFCQNSPWYTVAMWGAMRIGGVFCGNNPAYSVEEMTYSLKKCGAKFVIADGMGLERAVKACETVGIEKNRIFLLESDRDGGGGVVEGTARGEGYVGLRKLCEIGRGWGEMGQVSEYTLKEGESNTKLLAFLAFSSGTTGFPKAAMVSHSNVIAQCLQIKALYPPNNPDIGLAILPFFHITGLILSLHASFLLNRTVVILPAPFSMDAMLRACTAYKIPVFTIVPPIILRLLNDPTISSYDLSHITRVTSGAAPLSTEAISAFESRFPWISLSQGYGMTEATGCLTATPYYLLEKSGKTAPKGSVGLICPSTSIRIVGEDGKEVTGGTGPQCQGEIRARGPQCITLGYLGDEAASKSLWDDEGWLRTGDWGWVDENGWLYVGERVKEMIKVKGTPVAPAELEDCLLGHPSVADAAVIGVPHAYSGEVPRAYVVLKEGILGKGNKERERERIGKELIEWVKERKSRAKWITGGVKFVEEIPKSPSGKILRRMLKGKVKQEEGVTAGTVAKL